MVPITTRKAVFSYTVAFLLVTAALAASLQIRQFEARITFVFFFAAVITTTWYGGRYPGIFAIVLSTLVSAYYTVEPLSEFSLTTGGMLQLIAFVGVAFLINWVTANFQHREGIFRRDHDVMRIKEDRLMKVFGNCPVAVMVNRISDYSYVDVNEQFTRLTGWSRDEVIGRTSGSIKLVDPDEVKQIRVDLALNKKVVDRELTVFTRNGERRHTIMGTVIVDMGGEPHAITTIVDVTSRHLAEKARTESDERLRIATETAKVGLVMLNSEYRFTFANDAYAELTGLDKTGIIGRYMGDVFPGVFEEQVQPQLDRAFGGASLAYEHHNEGRSFAARYEPLYTDGRVSQVVVVIEDVTDQNLAEEQRQALEGRYRTLFEYNPDGILIADSNSYYLDANETMAGMLGYTRDELIGMHAADIVVLDEMENIEPALDVINSGEEYNREWQFKRKDGSKFAGDVVAVQMQDGNLMAVIRDITEAKEARLELKESQERYRDLVENAIDIIYTHDLKGNYISVNEAVEKITGYTEQESLTMNMIDLVAPEYIEIAREMTAAKLSGKEVTAYELEIIAKDGRRIMVEINSRIINEDGVPVRVQGIARDITERRELEFQLRQSQKLDAIGQLAGGIAHDFNNLLTVINGYSDIALKKLHDGDPLATSIREIRGAGDRAAALTGQLLAFSRKQVLKPRVHNLNSVILEMEKMLSRIIRESIEFSIDLDPDLGNIMADPGQMEQVIMNLAVNARDAMVNGGSLKIETKNVHLDPEYVSQHLDVVPGDFIKMTVTDTGEGIEEPIRKRIFEPFFTTKEQGKGTGLGLSTVYGILKQSGGDILTHTESGRGTSFEIFLPIVNQQVQSSGWEQDGVDQTGSETVLLVEDEELVRNLAREILESLNYTVLAAPDGDMALRICKSYEERIDLLLTDVIMPRMSGPELKNKVVELRPGIKSIFMSGYADDLLSKTGVLESDRSFIEKPFTPDGLARKVREILES